MLLLAETIRSGFFFFLKLEEIRLEGSDSSVGHM